MRTLDQQPKLPDDFLSIDDWQDPQPMTGSWYNNPLVGVLGVIGSITFLFCLTAFLPQRVAEQNQLGAPDLGGMGARADEMAGHDHVPESRDLNEVLAELSGNAPWDSLAYLENKASFDPSQKQLVQQEIMNLLATRSIELEGHLGVFTVWFDTEDRRRISALLKRSSDQRETMRLAGAMSHLPNPVPALIAELVEHDLNGEVHMALSVELSNHNVQPSEIAHQLVSKLQPSSTSKQFENTVLLLNGYSWETRSDADLKKLAAGAIAAAGRNLTSDQLERMDDNVSEAITKFAELPASSNLLEKVAATSNGTRSVMTFLSMHLESRQAGDLAAKLAMRDDKIRPRQLRNYENSELAQAILWEDRLQGGPELSNMEMSSSDASMRAFSKASLSLIKSNPNAALASLWRVVDRQKRNIKREGLSSQFLQKLDTLLAEKLIGDLRLPAPGSADRNKKRRPRRTMPASLNLAEHLGGRKSALAIQKASKKKPHVLQEFKGILDALIALNQPDTYDMIVNAWVFHGDGKLETIGKAIEPTFLRRLQRRVKGPNATRSDHRSAIKNMMAALGRVGTSVSVPVLKEQTQSKVEDFRKASAKALEMIRKRSSRG